MGDLSQRPPEAVLEAYGCSGAAVTNENAKKKKAVWYVERPGTAWVLKRSPLGEERLRFVLDAADHLRSRGVRIPKLVTTQDGRRYVSVPEGHFVMIERVSGRTPTYDRADDRRKILQGLAAFHRAGEGFSAEGQADPRVQLGEWPGLYLKRLNRLLEADGSGPFWDEARPHHRYFVDAARSALERLQRSAYADWVEETRRRGGLCHQDFAAGNLILEPSGDLAVLDLDSVSVEIPARDLRKIVLKVLKKRDQWDDGLARSLLAHYQQVNPLGADRYEVVQIDLLFPHLYHGLIDKYLGDRAPDWSQEKFLTRLRQVVAFERQKTEALARSGTLTPAGLDGASLPPRGGDR